MASQGQLGSVMYSILAAAARLDSGHIVELHELEQLLGWPSKATVDRFIAQYSRDVLEVGHVFATLRLRSELPDGSRIDRLGYQRVKKAGKAPRP